MRLLRILLIYSLFLPPLLCAQEATHILQKNETLYSISRQYNVDVRVLLKVNGIEDPRNLPVGLELTIPLHYTVKRGDTLYSIAKEFGTTVSILREENGLEESYILKVDDVLIVPKRTADEGKQSDDQKEERQPSMHESGIRVSEGEEKTPTISDRPDDRQARDSTKLSESGVEEEKQQVEVTWPVRGERSYQQGKLAGTQIIGKKGDVVVSISSGEVVWVGPYRGFGNVVLIQSPNRYVYVYGGNETITVNVGEEVSPGMKIGTLGIHPHEKKPILFFSVFKDGKPVHPVKAPRI